MQIEKCIVIKNALGQDRGYLFPDDEDGGVKDAYVDRYLSAEETLTFFIPPTNPKVHEMTPECQLVVGDREFTILRPDAIDVMRDQEGKMWLKVMAVGSWVLMDKDVITVSNDPQQPVPADLQVAIISGGQAAGGYPQGSAGSALTYLLQDHPVWTLGIVDAPGTHDLETEKFSLLQNIMKVQELWGGCLLFEYVFDAEHRNIVDRKIHLRSEEAWQPYTGFGIRYSKNQKHITRTDNNDIVTRLYGFGQDDLDISSVNDGKKYLENFSYSSNTYVGFYQNQEIHDPQELKDKMAETLEKLCHPRHSYRIGLVDTTCLPDWSHEKFALGDLADIYDPDVADDRARIVRHKYNVFQPWKCELDLGEPEKRLTVQLASSFNAANYVRKALRPNHSVSNLLKAFVDTFTTTINSANGKLVWDDSTLQAIEIDGEGEETGNRVRITPGGVGISIDGGQTYTTAMTGAGVLANTVIVNELYALSAADGLSRLTGHGLEILDDDMILRALLGWRMEGEIKKYGLTLWNKAGDKVVLDEDGSLQTWQDNPGADNFDPDHPYKFDVYIPPETTRIDRAILRFRLENFRAYEKGAASGGGSTSGSSSSSTTQSANENILISNYVFLGGPSGDTTYYGYADADTHNHGIASGTILNTPDGSVTYLAFNGDSHNHAVYNHGHQYTAYGHSHGMAHTHSTPDHVHGLDFGIYASTTPQNVTIKINGVDRTSELGGPYNSDQSNINIADYLNIGQWNTIEFTTTRLGRIAPAYFIQCFMMS